MNAPDRPPTCDEAMTPPFFTASLSSASAAVVPCVPQTSRPISSRIAATRVAHRRRGRQGQIDDAEGHVQPLATLRSATSWPMRVMWKAVRLIVSRHYVEGLALARSSSATLDHAGAADAHADSAQSPSPGPWNAPAMKGLSSTALAEDHQLGAAQAVVVRGQLGGLLDRPCPSCATASMSMPARVEADVDRRAEEARGAQAPREWTRSAAGRPRSCPCAPAPNSRR